MQLAVCLAFSLLYIIPSGKALFHNVGGSAGWPHGSYVGGRYERLPPPDQTRSGHVELPLGKDNSYIQQSAWGHGGYNPQHVALLHHPVHYNGHLNNLPDDYHSHRNYQYQPPDCSSGCESSSSSNPTVYSDQSTFSEPQLYRVQGREAAYYELPPPAPHFNNMPTLSPTWDDPMDLESLPLLRRIGTGGQGGVRSSSGAGSSYYTDSLSEPGGSDDMVMQQQRQAPTTARMRRLQREAEPEKDEENLSPAGPLTTLQKEQRKFRNWLREEWRDRAMHFGMAAQTLAQKVAEIKIMFPEQSPTIGHVSGNFVDKAMAHDEEYRFDYHTWSNTYRMRINNLKAVYEKKGYHGIQLQQALLANYLDTKAKHHATLADPVKEANEVSVSREVWDEFVQDALQTELDAGKQLSLELIAEHSWNYISRIYTRPETNKYLSKYLTKVMGLKPHQIAELKKLQDAVRDRVAPPTARGRKNKKASKSVLSAGE